MVSACVRLAPVGVGGCENDQQLIIDCDWVLRLVRRDCHFKSRIQQLLWAPEQIRLFFFLLFSFFLFLRHQTARVRMAEPPNGTPGRRAAPAGAGVDPLGAAEPGEVRVVGVLEEPERRSLAGRREVRTVSPGGSSRLWQPGVA